MSYVVGPASPVDAGSGSSSSSSSPAMPPLSSPASSSSSSSSYAPPFPTRSSDTTHGHDQEDAPQPQCRHCHSRSLVLDWSAGDRVCTSCGVVHEQHVRDTGPEWRDFRDADDLAKGLPSLARSGLIPVDETRHVGGLEPTALSYVPFGGGSYGHGSGEAASAERGVRRNLMRAHRKIEAMVERDHEESLRRARVARKVMARRREERRRGSDIGAGVAGAHDGHRRDASERDDDGSEVRVTTTGDFESLLAQEEEDGRRMRNVLRDGKWSLDRAILLHGTDDELDRIRPGRSTNHPHHRLPGHRNGGYYGGGSRPNSDDVEEERTTLRRRLDASAKDASNQLYRAHTMLVDASERLKLPDLTASEAQSMLLQYVALRDGLKVAGVSSSSSSSSSVEHKSYTDKQAENERRRRQLDFKKARQSASLGAALLYLASKKSGLGRSLVEVCDAFRPPPLHDDDDDVHYGDGVKGLAGKSKNKEEALVKPKHCSRAMNEVRSTLPDYVRSVASAAAASVPSSSSSGAVASHRHAHTATDEDAVAVSNLALRFAQKLDLPADAARAVQTIASHCVREQRDCGVGSGASSSILCASVSYLVSEAGSTMQRLAEQALRHHRKRLTEQAAERRRSRLEAEAFEATDKKKRRHIRAGENRAGKKARLVVSSDGKPVPVISSEVVSSGDVISAKNTGQAYNVSSISSSAVKEETVRSEKATVGHSGSCKEEISSGTGDDVPRQQANKEMSKVKEEELENASDAAQPHHHSDIDPGYGESFDVLSHSPVEEGSEFGSESERDALQAWEAWSQQPRWSRASDVVVRRTGVSRSALLSHYRKVLYPRRRDLLEVLQRRSGESGGDGEDEDGKAVHDSPLARTLFCNIAAAAPLMVLSEK